MKILDLGMFAAALATIVLILVFGRLGSAPPTHDRAAAAAMERTQTISTISGLAAHGDLDFTQGSK